MTMRTDDTVLEVLHGRHNHLIDPSLHIWEWQIPVYLFLGGLAAGLLILAAGLELRRGAPPRAAAVRFAPLAAAAILSLGMLALFLDLEYKLHVYRFYLAFEPTSPMSWGSWILILVYPAAILMGLGSLTGDERTRASSFGLLRPFRGAIERAVAFSVRRRRPILWSSIAVGAALGAYTGLLLGTLAARPQWNTAILGPLFLASGMSTGAALLLLLGAGDDAPTLLRWDMILIGAELALIVLMILDLATGSEAQQMAAGQLLGGTWTAVFWSLVVVTGLLVPFAMETAEIKRHLRPTVVAPLLILIGGLSLRWILLVAGQASTFGLLH
jgi:formate-dependent nitrite reductase membrane component NrfD